MKVFISYQRADTAVAAHALAYATKLAPTLSRDAILLVNLSGRGDKDMATVAERTQATQPGTGR